MNHQLLPSQKILDIALERFPTCMFCIEDEEELNMKGKLTACQSIQLANAPYLREKIEPKRAQHMRTPLQDMALERNSGLFRLAGAIATLKSLTGHWAARRAIYTSLDSIHKKVADKIKRDYEKKKIVYEKSKSLDKIPF